MEWIDLSEPRTFKFLLQHEGAQVATITKSRQRAAAWHGWLKDQGHKFGPFTSKAAAKRWAEKAIALSDR